jgi:hypothetical protein
VAPPISVSVLGGPYSVAAGATARLAGNATCGAPPCTYKWAVGCPAAGALGAQSVASAGLAANVTTGANGGGGGAAYQINTAQLAAPRVCGATLTGTGGVGVVLRGWGARCWAGLIRSYISMAAAGRR